MGRKARQSKSLRDKENRRTAQGKSARHDEQKIAFAIRKISSNLTNVMGFQVQVSKLRSDEAWSALKKKVENDRRIPDVVRARAAQMPLSRFKRALPRIIAAEIVRQENLIRELQNEASLIPDAIADRHIGRSGKWKNHLP